MAVFFQQHPLLLIALIVLPAAAAVGLVILAFTAPGAAAGLLRFALQGLLATLKALAFAVVGALAAVLHALPWVIRIGGPVLYVWLALKAWPVLAGLYGATPPHLRYTLLAVVLAATLLPVVYVGARRSQWLWGAFYASAALLWLAWKRLPLAWPRYGLLFLLAVPGAYIILTALLMSKARMRQMRRRAMRQNQA